MLGTNIGEVITVFFAMILWRATPLLSMQLLWINLVTDSLPAIALGMEPVEKDIMNQKPRPKTEGLFANGLGVRVVLQGLMFAILTLIGFKVGESRLGIEAGRTMAFMVLSLSQVIQAYNMRSNHSLFKIGPFTNSKLNWSVLASVALVALVLFTPLKTLFGLVTLSWKLYVFAIGLILVPLVIMEFGKFIAYLKNRNKN